MILYARHQQPDHSDREAAALWGQHRALVSPGFDAAGLHQHLSLLQSDVECPGCLFARDSSCYIRASDCANLNQHQNADQNCAGQRELYDSACCFRHGLLLSAFARNCVRSHRRIDLHRPCQTRIAAASHVSLALASQERRDRDPLVAFPDTPEKTLASRMVPVFAGSSHAYLCRSASRASA